MINPRENIEEFTIFCDYFLSCAHGKKDYKAKAEHMRVSSFTTISTEAYTITYIANSYDAWMEEAADKTQDPVERKENKKNYKAKLWTSNAHAARIYGGWQVPGLKYYMNKATEVQAVRKSMKDHELEDLYMQNAKRMYGKKIRPPRHVTQETDLVTEMYSDGEGIDIDEDDVGEDSDEE